MRSGSALAAALIALPALRGARPAARRADGTRRRDPHRRDGCRAVVERRVIGRSVRGATDHGLAGRRAAATPTRSC